MASIKNLLPDECTVIRDGTQRRIMGSELVPGDVLHIKMGDKLPADIRFVQVTPDGKFDRSILTGETVPVRGTVESTDSNYLETACIGLAGTHCVSGNSVGIVVSTGDNSVFGRLAKLANAPKKGMTTLEKEICK
jgi:sodium/potassium-transporting ATPase subunit alpha